MDILSSLSNMAMSFCEEVRFSYSDNLTSCIKVAEMVQF